MDWYFVRWKKQRVMLRMLDVLRQRVRQAAGGRDAALGAGIIAPQSGKAAGTVCRGTRGYDAGKKVVGRKRFIVTGTLPPAKPTAPSNTYNETLLKHVLRHRRAFALGFGAALRE